MSLIQLSLVFFLCLSEKRGVITSYYSTKYCTC